jgi:hypothetical protein
MEFDQLNLESSPTKSHLQDSLEETWDLSIKEYRVLSRKLPDKLQSHEHYEALSVLEDELYSTQEFNEIKKIFSQYSKTVGLKGVSLQKNEVLEGYSHRIPVSNVNSDYYIIFSKRELEIQELEKLVMTIGFLHEAIIETTSLNQKSETLSSLKEILNIISFPLCLLKDDHIVLQNNAYSKSRITPRQSMKDLKKENVYHNEKFYKISVSEVTLDKSHYFILLYLPMDTLFKSDADYTNEELGIVTSSIAHELNNPLAGILAALEVLAMDDLTSENEELLLEMKKGVTRCKNLVETFLGFSKYKQDQKIHDVNLEQLLDRSLDLIRFRMVESGGHIQLDYKNDSDSFLSLKNESLFIMFFYLLFGELLTSHSHNQLVDNRESSESLIITVLKKEGTLVLYWTSRLKLKDNFFESKLIKHILLQENLSVKSELGSLAINLL